MNDFESVIIGAGVEGLYVLHGIESAGLTASLSLAQEIRNKIDYASV